MFSAQISFNFKISFSFNFKVKVTYFLNLSLSICPSILSYHLCQCVGEKHVVYVHVIVYIVVVYVYIHVYAVHAQQYFIHLVLKHSVFLHQSNTQI